MALLHRHSLAGEDGQSTAVLVEMQAGCFLCLSTTSLRSPSETVWMPAEDLAAGEQCQCPVG